MSIEERIAEVLRGHRLTDEPTWANERVCTCGAGGLHTLIRPGWEGHVASVLVAELGLTEFECEGDHWWSTKFYPIDDMEQRECDGRP